MVKKPPQVPGPSPVPAPIGHESARWRAHTRLEKYTADYNEYVARYGPEEGARRFALENRPYEVIEREGNLLLVRGAEAIWGALAGAGDIPYDNAHAQIGVGSSNKVPVSSQTDLQAGTTKFYKGMDAGFPTVAGNIFTLKATFASTEANFAWQEWGVTNSSVMLNRATTDLGDKTTASSWAFTVQLSLG